MLQEVASEDLPSLLERLHSFLPESTTVHGVLKIRLRHGLGAERRILVAPAPSSLVVITGMVAGMEMQTLTLFWDSEHEEDEALAKLLASTPHVDWNNPLFFYGVPFKLLQKVDQMMSGQLGEAGIVAQPISRSYLYTVTNSTLSTTPRHYRLPKEFRLGPIKEDHAEYLHKHWIHGSLEPLESYRSMLRSLPGVGVYTTAAPSTAAGDEIQNNEQTVSRGKTLEDTRAKSVHGKMSLGNTLERTVTKDAVPRETLSTDGDEVGWPETNALPVAWTSMSINNLINNTFTLNEYRRRGLGRAVTAALAAFLLQEDERVSAYIIVNNEASIKLHEQLGFIRECVFGWQRYLLKDSET